MSAYFWDLPSARMSSSPSYLWVLGGGMSDGKLYPYRPYAWALNAPVRPESVCPLKTRFDGITLGASSVYHVAWIARLEWVNRTAPDIRYQAMCGWMVVPMDKELHGTRRLCMLCLGKMQREAEVA